MNPQLTFKTNLNPETFSYDTMSLKEQPPIEPYMYHIVQPLGPSCLKQIPRFASVLGGKSLYGMNSQSVQSVTYSQPNGLE